MTKDRVFKIPYSFITLYKMYEDNEPVHIILEKEGETDGFHTKQYMEYTRRRVYGGPLADALIRVITRFPLSRIKTCQKPDCGNYFYQGNTRGKGDYCSPKCKNWAKTKRWRKANPDKYNNYQRAYHSEQRDKAKQDRVEVKCPSCGLRESRGLLGDYLKRYSGLQDCPHCKKAKLSHIVNRWDKDERDWKRQVYDDKEWNRYLKGIQKGEK